MEKDVATSSADSFFLPEETWLGVISGCGLIAHWMMAQVSRAWRERACNSIRRQMIARWKEERAWYPAKRLRPVDAEQFELDETTIAGSFCVIEQDDFDPLPRCRIFPCVTRSVFWMRAIAEELAAHYLRVEIATDARYKTTLYRRILDQWPLTALQSLPFEQARTILLALKTARPMFQDALAVLSGRVDCLPRPPPPEEMRGVRRPHISDGIRLAVRSQSLPVVVEMQQNDGRLSTLGLLRLAMEENVSLVFLDELIAMLDAEQGDVYWVDTLSGETALARLLIHDGVRHQQPLRNHWLLILAALVRWTGMSLHLMVEHLAAEPALTIRPVTAVQLFTALRARDVDPAILLRKVRKRVAHADCPYDVDKVKHPAHYKTCPCPMHIEDRARDELGLGGDEKGAPAGVAPPPPAGARIINPVYPIGLRGVNAQVRVDVGEAAANGELFIGGAGGNPLPPYAVVTAPRFNPAPRAEDLRIIGIEGPPPPVPDDPIRILNRAEYNRVMLRLFGHDEAALRHDAARAGAPPPPADEDEEEEAGDDHDDDMPELMPVNQGETELERRTAMREAIWRALRRWGQPGDHETVD